MGALGVNPDHVVEPGVPGPAPAASDCVICGATSPGPVTAILDVVGLEYPIQVRLIRLALPQPLERRLLIPESLEEREGKLHSVEGSFGQRGDGLLDLDGVHDFIVALQCRARMTIAHWGL
jgi:hypothetical protein